MFGGLAPLPLRLGGSPTEGVTAAQHARFCADMVAVGRTSPLASVTVDIANQTAANHLCKRSVGSVDAPNVVKTSTGVATVTWGATLEDEYENVAGIRILQAQADGVGATAFDATHVITAPNQVTVYGWNSAGSATDGVVELTVWGRSPWHVRDDIGEYGGALDKIDDDNENRLTYHAVWYDELGGTLGTAYTTARNTHVHVRKLALARALGAVSRAYEKTLANSVPDTADEKLEKWALALAVPFTPDDPAYLVRSDVAAKFRQIRGAAFSSLHESLTRLLGARFVELHQTTSADLSTSLPNTYWPGVNPGDSLLDLGPGTWTSERSHVWVEVVQPSSITEPEFFNLMNVKLPRFLSVALPGHVSFNWATGDGFILDVSLLDFAAVT